MSQSCQVLNNQFIMIESCHSSSCFMIWKKKCGLNKCQNYILDFRLFGMASHAEPGLKNLSPMGTTNKKQQRKGILSPLPFSLLRTDFRFLLGAC